MSPTSALVGAPIAAQAQLCDPRLLTTLATFFAVFRRSSDNSYAASREQFGQKRAQLLLLCIATIYPAFGLLDWLVYPRWVGSFVAFRCLIAALAIGLWRWSRGSSLSRLSELTAWLAGFATSGVSIMCALTEGYASRYLVGVMLCCLGITTVEMLEPRALAVLVAAVVLVYGCANAVVPVESTQPISSLAFLNGVLFFCVLCSALLEEQRRSLFAAHAALVQRNIELKHAKEQQSKFLSTISHELRSPINSVLGFTELVLEREANLQPKSRDNLMRIQQGGRHLLRLINDLLDLAKTEAGRLELEITTFDVGPILLEVADQTRALVSDRPIQVTVSAPEQCMVQSDATRLRQILVNLTSNAAKFTQAGSIHIAARAEADALVLEVRDTGIGIPPEHRGLIFEAFRQVHHGLATGGTGLGLNIVSQLAALMRGSIEVESEVGHGSLFRVRFSGIRERAAA